MSKKDSGRQFITDKSGKKVAVIIAVQDYNQIMEDIHDLKVIAERKNEKSVSVKEMINRVAL